MVENEAVRLLVTRSVGPRILSFGFRDGENLLALLPDFTTECPGRGLYHFYGGHRLWRAPEVAEQTYLPDDSPVSITDIGNGLRAVQDTDVNGLQKSLEVRLDGDEARVEVLHRFTNRGEGDLTGALWAVTQFRPGGTAVLPQSDEDTGSLPNRTLTLWPYTDPADPNLRWGRRHILVGTPMGSAFKIGFPNPRGWLAYWQEAGLFVKRARFDAQAGYPDFGSSSECYVNQSLLELETLGPVRTLAPGESVEHVETWELYAGIERPRDEAGAQALADQLERG